MHAKTGAFLAGLAIVLTATCLCGAADDFLPGAAALKTDRPRLLIRPKATPYAISLAQLKAIPRDAEFRNALGKLKRQKNAAAQAMVYLLTGEKAAADKAVAWMRAFKPAGKLGPFRVYFGFRRLALAYDWLYDYPGFTAEIKAEVRRNAQPLVKAGLRIGDDHLFHNYVWMSNGGLALWALATAGEDAEADKLWDVVRDRLANRMFPGLDYLGGCPSEPMGYYSLYCYSPGVFALLAAQSALEKDLIGAVAKGQGDWLAKHFAALMLTTQPNMRYLPFGDMQGGGDGGVAHEMAQIIDATTWAMRSALGAYFSRWLAGKRRLARYYGESVIFYFLYARQLPTRTAEPPLAMLAGGKHGGHVLTRSGWADGDTLVAFRCGDHYGSHNHFDQGSFVIYRNGLLALDAGYYKSPGGSQQKTEPHNTLLIGGKGQRRVRGQWFKTVAEFKKNLTGGKRLETGDMLFYEDAPGWTAAAGQFAQAYPTGTVASCVRQLLFVRPGVVVVVDRLVAPKGKTLGEVQWLLHTPAAPKIEGASLTVANAKSWLHCLGLKTPTVKPSLTTLLNRKKHETFQATYTYAGGSRLRLVHVLQVGDGAKPTSLVAVKVSLSGEACEVLVGKRTFTFGAGPDFKVVEVKR